GRPALPPRALARAVPALDAQHPGLEYFPPALARPPDPRVDLCQRPRGRLPQRPAAMRTVRRPAPDAGPGRAGYLVLVIALALRPARVADRYRRPAPFLPDAGARHGSRHPLPLGGPHGLHEPAFSARGALLR